MTEIRKTAADYTPETLQLFDHYVHGRISRRDFLSGVARYATAGMSALAILQSLQPNYALGQQVSPDDPRLSARFQQFDSPQGYGVGLGYLVGPADYQTSGHKYPVVLVVHENRGLNPHIQDVARRLALAGFIAFAPDALFAVGGYPGDDDKARTLFGTLDQTKARQDFIAAAKFLQALEQSNGKLGVTGFCYGGGIANFLATQLPELKAAVPFYGRQAEASQIASIQAPLLIHYASNDEMVNVGASAYDDALKAAGKSAISYTYANTQHGFHNDTTPRYDKAAAELAWQRTLAFFNQHLR